MGEVVKLVHSKTNWFRIISIPIVFFIAPFVLVGIIIGMAIGAGIFFSDMTYNEIHKKIYGLNDDNDLAS